MSATERVDWPLSWSQRAMWHVYQLARESSVYHIALRADVLGDLDAAALRTALQALVDRHPATRTTVSLRGEDQNAVQTVHAALAVDFGDHEGAVGATDLDAAVLAEANRPFDLTRQPPLRVRRFEADGQEVLLFVFHHIAWDFESVLLAFEELAVLYRSALQGTEAELPAPGTPFAEHGTWEAGFLEGPAGRRGLEFWDAQLADLPPVADLPADRPRLPARSYRGGVHHLPLPAELAEEVERVAKEAGVTRYVVLLAAFKVFLAKMTGQRSVVLGTAGSQRMRPQVRRTVGNFVNPLVLSTEVTGELAFSELLHQLSSSVLRAMRHGSVPFPALVERLRPEYDPSRSPLFDTLFVYDRPQDRRRDGVAKFVSGNGSADVGGLLLRSTPLANTSAVYDLTLYVFDATDALTLRWEYNRDLFDASTATRFAAHYTAVLRQCLRASGRPLAELDGLPDAERRTLLTEWSGTSQDWPGPRLLHQLVEQQVDRTPDAVAAVFEGRSLTYRELDRRADQLAARLRREGVGPESRVGVCLPRSLELVVALLGVLKAGGAYVPMDPEYPHERLRHLLTDSSAQVLLTCPSGGLPDDLLAAFPGTVVVLDEDLAVLDGESAERVDSGVRPRNLAYVIHTSGSTGLPKGAMNEHEGVVNRLRWMQQRYGLDASDRVLQKTPFGFDVSVWEFFWPLASGARLVLARPGGHRDVRHLVELCRAEEVTTVHFVPSMLQSFLDSGDRAPLPALRRVLCSGEALTPRLAAAFHRAFDCELHNLYGPTEAAIDVTARPCLAGEDAATVPIGRPVANTAIRILDEDLQPVPVGVPGELYISGVQVGRGYLGRPDLTAERFLPDPFAPGRMYRTGDLARWNRSGEIEYLGREDGQVKIRGYRVEPEEVRHGLEAVPGIAEAVVGVHRVAEEPRLLAHVVLDTPGALTTTAIRGALRGRFPEYMIPAGIVAVDALPVGPHGKIDRGRLPEPGPEAWIHQAEHVPPRSPLEEELAEIWGELLGVVRVGVHDNFFDIGGHSLLAARLVTLVAHAFAVRMPVSDIFTHPTLEAFTECLLTRVLEDEDTAQGAAL
ncbi:non-ribosomal peptide synthetase [Streptomyces melanogenes]|uniref:non-ribosomal peptide synthetase n=1 Tax=Streptomyces melanogenes TaxID=67326 RepID=UPI00167CEB7C|nr:non-ribosomal peptide synthetase [Streptomyces melanogenes]GGP83993.1 hypothetical protein GCM10010278_73120 [Streptomyces melanogenes]